MDKKEDEPWIHFQDQQEMARRVERTRQYLEALGIPSEMMRLGHTLLRASEMQTRLLKTLSLSALIKPQRVQIGITTPGDLVVDVFSHFPLLHEHDRLGAGIRAVIIKPEFANETLTALTLIKAGAWTASNRFYQMKEIIHNPAPVTIIGSLRHFMLVPPASRGAFIEGYNRPKVALTETDYHTWFKPPLNYQQDQAADVARLLEELT